MKWFQYFHLSKWGVFLSESNLIQIFFSFVSLAAMLQNQLSTES